MDKKAIFQVIEKNGGRMTPLRETLVNLFFDSKKPLSVPEILDMLGRLGSEVNKTSVYRQIQAFVDLHIGETLIILSDPYIPLTEHRLRHGRAFGFNWVMRQALALVSAN